MVKSYLCAFQQASYTLKNGRNIVFADMCDGIRGSLYTSSNKAEQVMIESLSDFGCVIKVYKVYGEPEPDMPTLNKVVKVSVVVPKETENSNPIKEYLDITRVQDAISIIKEICVERELEYKVIRSRDAVIDRAKYLNISFPNLN